MTEATHLELQNEKSPLHFFLRLGAFIVFALLLLIGLGQREFWIDEVITAGHVVGLNNTVDAFHPRGYYLLLYGWKLLFGEGDLSLRLFSIPWALLSLGLLLAVGQRLVSRNATTLAMWLFALSPMVILHFRMARFYSMVTAVFMLVIYCATLVVMQGKRRHWAGLSLSILALLNTNYVASLMLLPLMLWVGLNALRGKKIWRFVVCVLPSIFMLLWVAQELYYKVGKVAEIEAAGNISGFRLLAAMVLPGFSLAVSETIDLWRVWVVVPALLVAGIGFVKGLITLGQRPEGRILRWGWPVGVVILAGILTIAAKGEPLSSASRSALFLSPLAYITLAAGLVSLKSVRWRGIFIGALLVVYGYGLLNYSLGRQFLNPAYVTPWKQVAELIKKQEKPGDLVLSYFDSTLQRYGNFANFIEGRDENDWAYFRLKRVETWPQSGGRVWLVTRDRGSTEARRSQDEMLQKLSPRASQVEQFDFMPYPELDRKMRKLILGREPAEYYITVYLFTP